MSVGVTLSAPEFTAPVSRFRFNFVFKKIFWFPRLDLRWPAMNQEAQMEPISEARDREIVDDYQSRGSRGGV